MLLLERLLPGRPLSEVEDDEELTEVAAGILERLWRLASLCSPSVAGPPIVATLAGWERAVSPAELWAEGGS